MQITNAQLALVRINPAVRTVIEAWADSQHEISWNPTATIVARDAVRTALSLSRIEMTFEFLARTNEGVNVNINFANGQFVHIDTGSEFEWTGSLDPFDPAHYWADHRTGERVDMVTGERSVGYSALVPLARQYATLYDEMFAVVKRLAGHEDFTLDTDFDGDGVRVYVDQERVMRVDLSQPTITN